MTNNGRRLMPYPEYQMQFIGLSVFFSMLGSCSMLLFSFIVFSNLDYAIPYELTEKYITFSAIIVMATTALSWYFAAKVSAQLAGSAVKINNLLAKIEKGIIPEEREMACRTGDWFIFQSIVDRIGSLVKKGVCHAAAPRRGRSAKA